MEEGFEDYEYGSQALNGGTPGASTSPQSDAELLKQALMNEKASPAILAYEADLVERIELQLQHQEAEIQEAEKDNEKELLRTIYTVEMTRVRYMLRSYLRTRLHKVERFVMHCIDSPAMRQRLSPLEDGYAQQFLVLVGNHLKTSVTSKLPAAFSSLVKQASAHPANDMIPAPDTGRHVFCRVLRDLGQVAVYEDGGTHELNRGDLYIMRYRMLAPLLAEGSVQLI